MLERLSEEETLEYAGIIRWAGFISAKTREEYLMQMNRTIEVSSP